MTRSGLTHAVFSNRDCDIHYWHRPGSGDKHILLFHGAGVDHRMFELQLDAFGEAYCVTLWDARGHGQSKLPAGKRFSFEDMVSDVWRLYDALGIDRAILIGQSMGGNLAQEVSYRCPERVDRLVLIDCTSNTGRLTASERWMLRLTGPIFACYPWKTLIRQSAKACGNREHVRQYVLECFNGMEKSAFIDVMMSLISCLHEDEAYRFAHPVLLLCGSDDKTGNIRKIARAWAQSDDHCTLCMIEAAGHNANQDEPEAVNDYIVRFLEGRL